MSHDLEKLLVGLREQSRSLSGLRILACPDCTEKNQKESKQDEHMWASQPSQTSRSPSPGVPMPPSARAISPDEGSFLRPPFRALNANVDEPFDDSLVAPGLTRFMSYTPCAKERSRSPMNDVAQPSGPLAATASVSPRALDRFSPCSSSSPSPVLSSSVAYRSWGATPSGDIGNSVQERARARSLSPARAGERRRSSPPGVREAERLPREVQEKASDKWVRSSTLPDRRSSPYKESDWRHAAIINTQRDGLQPLHEAFRLHNAHRQIQGHEQIPNRIGVEKEVAPSPKYGFESTPQTRNRTVTPTQIGRTPFMETRQTMPSENRRECSLVCPKRPDGDFYLVPSRPNDLAMRAPGMPPDPVPSPEPEETSVNEAQDRMGLSFSTRPGYLEYVMPFTELKPLRFPKGDNVPETLAAAQRISETHDTTPKSKLPYRSTYEGFFRPPGAPTPSKEAKQQYAPVVNFPSPANHSGDANNKRVGAQKLMTSFLPSPEHKPRDVHFQPEPTRHGTTVLPLQQKQYAGLDGNIPYDYPVPPRGRGSTPRLQIPTVVIPSSPVLKAGESESTRKRSRDSRADSDGDALGVKAGDVALVPPRRAENPDDDPSFSIPRARIRRAGLYEKDPSDDTYSFPAFQVYCYLDGRAAASHKRCEKSQVR